MFTHNLTDEYGNLLYGNKIIEVGTTTDDYSMVDGTTLHINHLETNNWYKIDDNSESISINPNKNVTDKIIVAHLIFKPASEISVSQNFIVNEYNLAHTVIWPYGEPTEYKNGFTYIIRIEQYSREKILAYLENIHPTT